MLSRQRETEQGAALVGCIMQLVRNGLGRQKLPEAVPHETHHPTHPLTLDPKPSNSATSS